MIFLFDVVIILALLGVIVVIGLFLISYAIDSIIKIIDYICETKVERRVRMRLIDADKLEKEWIYRFGSMYGKDCAYMFKEAINEQPTVGKALNAQWEIIDINFEERGTKDIINVFRCTHCRTKQASRNRKYEDIDIVKEIPYCPHCGAKMIDIIKKEMK